MSFLKLANILLLTALTRDVAFGRMQAESMKYLYLVIYLNIYVELYCTEKLYINLEQAWWAVFDIQAFDMDTFLYFEFKCSMDRAAYSASWKN